MPLFRPTLNRQQNKSRHFPLNWAVFISLSSKGGNTRGGGEGGVYSFSSPIPSMQCCATVRATYRKQQTPQLWMDSTAQGRGVDYFVPWSYPIWEQRLNNFVANCRLVLVSYICFQSKWQLTKKLNNVYYKEYIHTQSLVLSFAASLYTSRAALWRARRKLKRLTKLLISTWHRGLM